MALSWFTQCCLGLAEMHARGVVHGNINPENILIVSGMAKLGDFGTIKDYDTASRFYLVGSPQYFAPEKKQVTH